MARPHPLLAETVEAYVRDGAVVLRGVLNNDELRTLEAGIEHNLAHLSPLALVASEPDDPGRFVEDFCTWQGNPDYRRILQDSALPHLAAQLMQSRTVRLYHDHLLVKEAGTRQPTPWHQDQPYYNVGGMQNVSFWIPVDPVPQASTLRFVAGSHDGTWYMPRTFRDQQAKWFPEGTLAELPPIDAEPDRYRQLAWALEPGDCVRFTCSACTPAAAPARVPAAGYSPLATWATMPCTRCVLGAPHPHFQGWTNGCPTACRWTTLFFPLSGPESDDLPWPPAFSYSLTTSPPSSTTWPP